MLKKYTIIEHLAEIRKRLVWIVLTFFVALIIAYINTDLIVDYLMKMAGKTRFIYTKPEELLMTYLKVDILTAAFATIPMISFQGWRFVTPALKKGEKLKVLFFFLLATIFFAVGVGFSLYIVTPLCLLFLAGFQKSGISAMLSIENYLSFIINMTVSFGLVFDLPAIVYFFASLRILKYKTVKRLGKYIIMVLLVLAAVLTPPDIISQVMLFIPLLMLYELSLFICYMFDGEDKWKNKLKALFRKKSRSMD